MGALEEILQRHPVWRGGALAKGIAALPTGFAPLDAELPRLAVAAEASRAVAFLYRPLAAAAESSPACLRLSLEPAGLELAVHLVKRRGAPLAAPLYLPLKRPFHVLGRAALSRPSGRDARAARRLGLPVHA